jgi:hypothetical protein
MIGSKAHRRSARQPGTGRHPDPQEIIADLRRQLPARETELTKRCAGDDPGPCSTVSAGFFLSRQNGKYGFARGRGLRCRSPTRLSGR